jgi:ethanolamine permease
LTFFLGDQIFAEQAVRPGKEPRRRAVPSTVAAKEGVVMAEDQKPRVERVGGLEYEHAGAEYMEKRRLERVAGPLLIWGLGVGYVISGEYFSWNFGFDAGGFGGFLIATLLMIALYVLMIYGVSEMATALPTTGGPYAFARRTMGPWGGFAMGIAAILEYVLATAAISLAIAAYVVGLPCCDALPNIIGLQDVEWIAIVAYAIFLTVNIIGVSESLRILFVITVISVATLILWAVVLLLGGHFDASNFTNIPPEAGNSSAFPFGVFQGVLAALPFAAWFYLAIEGTPMAAEETRDPGRDLPKGTILAMWSLVAFSAIAFIVGGGVGGAELLSTAGNPLPAAVEAAHGGTNWFFWVVTIVGLTGLVASFHSIIFAYSRIIYALSRAGYIPRGLSVTGTRRTPYLALVVPAILAFVAVFIYNRVDPEAAIANVTQMSVFGALVTYVLMMVAFILFRQREPSAERPYRSPVGIPGAVIVIAISVLAMFASLAYTPGARFGVLATIIVIGLGLAYFAGYSRHHLVAEAPEEEFAVMEKAEAELEADET